jgi:hypothetical protein
MSNIETGGPAFPVVGHFWGDRLGGQLDHGMTLRDYFAAKAMQGRMAGDYPWSDIGFTPVNGLTLIENEAVLAYRVADAMLKARVQ